MMENMENTYKVCIKCFTFNQANYIEDAMHGFVMQQTDFPYVAAVVDDASTDGEPEVIKRFLEKEFDMASAVQDETEDYVRVVAKHKTNVNCTFVVVFLKYNHYSIKKRKLPYFKEWFDNAKYIALCEGDDYWTDPLKLQRQVDFLEEHEEYSMSTENGLWLDIRTQESSPFSSEPERDVTFEEMLIKRRFPTASVLYRQCCQEKIAKLKPPTFDTLVWACLSKQGKIRYNPIISSVYRRGDGVTEKDKIRWAYTVRAFNISLCENFDIPAYIKNIRDKDVLENIYVGIKTAYKKNRYKDVVRLFFYSVKINPTYLVKRYIKRKK